MPARTPVKKPARRSAKTHAAKSAKTQATTPADVDRLFGEYVNAADLDSRVDLYEADAALGQLDGTAVRGHRAIREALNGLRAAQAKMEMKVVKVVKGGADVAVLFSDWRMKAVGPDEKPVEMTGKSLEVVRRQKNGTWRFVIDLPFCFREVDHHAKVLRMDGVRDSALLMVGSAFATRRTDGRLLGAGAPIASATVTLWAATAGAPVQLAQTQTGADGRFALELNKSPGSGGAWRER